MKTMSIFATMHKLQWNFCVWISLIWYPSHSCPSAWWGLTPRDFRERDWIVPVYVLHCSTGFLLSNVCSCNPTFWKQVLHMSPGHQNECWEQIKSLHVKPRVQSSAAVEPDLRLCWFLDFYWGQGRGKGREGNSQRKSQFSSLYIWLLTVQHWCAPVVFVVLLVVLNKVINMG